MKKILAFSGSPRLGGNSTILLNNFLAGSKENSAQIEVIDPYKINLKYCTGCLRCNIVKKCTLRDDDWENLSQKILESDVIVFASPVYFHHLTAPLKAIIDRFRSFVNVQITEESIKHTPWQEWKKDFVLILSMGSSDDIDAKPIVELFEYITEILGTENRLHVIKGTRLALAKQVEKNKDFLEKIYSKLNIPTKLAEEDFVKNSKLLKDSFELGEILS